MSRTIEARHRQSPDSREIPWPSAWMLSRLENNLLSYPRPFPVQGRAVPSKYVRARAAAAMPTWLPSRRPTKSSGTMWMPP